MSEMIAEFAPAPPRGGRTPGIIRRTHTGDAGRDLTCRLYSAETGALIATTESGQLPRGDDEANAAFIRLAWNSHDALVEAVNNDRAALQIALDHLASDTPTDVIAALKDRVAKVDGLLAEIEARGS
ncbi:hypothetical protein [Antarcticirhabdus aurantiaca]|uniref:Uncharacterized protein n=1 Tax=Antarcticirhabdus aurantiaca TaxID=2606717 RepID=A0ACD4NJD9_9HYPH|nr:hypothetical protein OXU80_18765 [Jeongeuplla avenae]